MQQFVVQVLMQKFNGSYNKFAIYKWNFIFPFKNNIYKMYIINLLY